MSKVHRAFIKPLGDKKKLKTLDHHSLVRHDIKANAWDYTAMHVLSIYLPFIMAMHKK